MSEMNDNTNLIEQLSKQSAATHEFAEEIVEDMESVLQLLRRIEQKQSGLEAKVDQISQQVQGSTQGQARELDRLRKELLDEQGTTLGVSLFNMVAGTLDNLYIMREHLAQDSELYHHVYSVVAMLEAMLRGVRISSFTAKVGEAFDPQRMRADSFEDNETEGVIRTMKYGYMIKDKVLREASVVLSRKSQTVD